MIKAKADRAEGMLVDACKVINQFDIAKRHLSTCITTIERLHMINKGIDQLRAAANRRKYHDVGNLIGAIDQLLHEFDKFSYVPYIKTLWDTSTKLKSELLKQVQEEFIRFGIISPKLHCRNNNYFTVGLILTCKLLRT